MILLGGEGIPMEPSFSIERRTSQSMCWKIAAQKRLLNGAGQHPGVEIISRDRSKDYARGATDGATITQICGDLKDDYLTDCAKACS